MRVVARSSGESPARCWPAARWSVAPRRGSSTAAPISSARAAGNDSTSVSSAATCSTSTPRCRSASANASCSSCARATHGTPSKSSWSLLRGVSRVSSGPGRCSITVRRRPTSLVAPTEGIGAVAADSSMAGRLAQPAPTAGPRSRDGCVGSCAGRCAMDLFDLSGKVAVVTGGTRGIGLMMARGLLQAGARVYVSSRKAEAGEEARRELAAHGTVRSIPADLSREEECSRLAAAVAEREDELHILVNNAGATWGAPLKEFPASAWDKVLDLNVKSPFFLTRAFLPLLEEAATDDDPARVVNVGSIDGLHVPPMHTYSYSASKAALHHLTRVLAKELGPRRITVNAVAPGPFESKMMAATLEAFGKEIAARSPLGRIGRPDDMAGVVVYLTSRAGAYLTGSVIAVDGGIATTR